MNLPPNIAIQMIIKNLSPSNHKGKHKAGLFGKYFTRRKTYKDIKKQDQEDLVQKEMNREKRKEIFRAIKFCLGLSLPSIFFFMFFILYCISQG